MVSSLLFPLLRRAGAFYGSYQTVRTMQILQQVLQPKRHAETLREEKKRRR